MTGQELYEKYAKLMDDQGVGVDSFDELEIQDKNAWEALSNLVSWVES